MIDWSDNTTEDDPPLGDGSDTPTADWNNGETQRGSVWADEPTVDELANSFAQEPYDTPEAPDEPSTDEFGRATGAVKVSFQLALQQKHQEISCT